MKRILCLLTISALFLTGCFSCSQDISKVSSSESFVPEISSSQVDSSAPISEPDLSQNQGYSNDTSASIVGDWVAPVYEDGAFRVFTFYENNRAQYKVGVLDGGYDRHDGTYAVNGNVITISLRDTLDWRGEDITANFSIEHGKLIFTNIHLDFRTDVWTKYLPDLPDFEHLLADMDEYVFYKSDDVDATLDYYYEKITGRSLR